MSEKIAGCNSKQTKVRKQKEISDRNTDYIKFKNKIKKKKKKKYRLTTSHPKVEAPRPPTLQGFSNSERRAHPESEHLC